MDHRCPRKCRPNLRGTHSSSRTRISPVVDKFVGLNQHGPGNGNRLGYLLGFYRWKIPKELRQRMATPQIIKQSFDRYSRPVEAGSFPHSLRVSPNVWLAHEAIFTISVLFPINFESGIVVSSANS